MARVTLMPWSSSFPCQAGHESFSTSTGDVQGPGLGGGRLDPGPAPPLLSLDSI